MAVHIKVPQKNVGPLKFGQEKEIKLKLFPFVALVKEVHLIGVGFMSKPITRIHERWVKVLNENEIYVFKQSFSTSKQSFSTIKQIFSSSKKSFSSSKNALNDCYVCQNYFGKVGYEDINLDPHISKVFSWSP